MWKNVDTPALRPSPAGIAAIYLKLDNSWKDEALTDPAIWTGDEWWGTTALSTPFPRQSGTKPFRASRSSSRAASTRLRKSGSRSIFCSTFRIE